MTIRTILVPIRGDGRGESVLDHALALGRRFNAHLAVVHCRSRPEDMLPFGVFVPTSFRRQITSSATALADDEESRIRALFKDYCSRHDLAITENNLAAPRDRPSASWSEATGKQAAVVAVRGRLADVIVVAQPDRDRNLGVNTLEAALLQTGRLVLLGPDAPVASLGRHVAIGWNGSSEAALAVTAALPILLAADQVTVLAAMTGRKPDLGPEELQAYLASHDCRAEIRSFEARATEVGQGLLGAAKAAAADLLLIGAYGQTRRRDLVMGGVTQHIVDHVDLPVPMIHSAGHRRPAAHPLNLQTPGALLY
jgi:nucleotide-binding universal stress UspA family protein